MDRRVRILRFLLLLVLTLVVWPELALFCWFAILPCPDCCVVDLCGTCTTGPPEQVQITISGCVNGVNCSNCSDMNATFVLDLQSTTAFGGFCTYTSSGPYTTCAFDYLRFTHTTFGSPGGLNILFVTAVSPTAGANDSGNRWATGSLTTDCNAWNQSVPWASDQYNLTGTSACVCNPNAASLLAL